MPNADTPSSCSHIRNASCNDCRLSDLCLPISLHMQDLDKLDRIVQRGRPLHKGDYLYRSNDTFASVFAVRSGCLKSVSVSADGREQVTGFHLPGELVGLDGLSEQQYVNSIIALDTAAVCEIPFQELEQLSQQLPSLQRHMLTLMSREIIHDQQLISLLSKHSAEERLAAFILSLSSRYQRRQQSATQFQLPMTRAEMGNYLGLTIETVSRVFSRLQKQALIHIDKRELQVLDPQGLQALANITLKSS